MSIRKRGEGKYVVDYYVIDSISGERKHRSKVVYGFNEAKKFEASVPKQEAVCTKVKTMNDYFEEFLLTLRVTKGTIIQDRMRFQKYVTFKDKAYDKITRSEIKNWAYEMSNSGLNNRTINTVYGLVKRTCKYVNVIYGIEDPSVLVNRLRETAIEKEILTPAEFDKVLSNEKNNIMRAFFYTAYWTGCRRGELKALYKEDLIDDCLYVRKTMSKGEESLKHTLKNGSTLKVVKLDDATLEMLKPLAQRQGKYLFGDETYLSNTTIMRYWEADLKASGIKKHITLHSLRHSHGSVLLDGGLDLASVSKRLGHSSISVTANVYSHELDKSGQKSVNLINSIKKNQ